MKKLFDNPKAAVVMIVMVILMFAAYKANATEMEISATYTGEFNGGYSLSLMERVFDDKVDLGIVIISDQQWEDVSVGNNGYAFAAFVAKKPDRWMEKYGLKLLPSEVHIGATYWIRTQSPINGCNAGYLLGLKWRVTEHASIGLRHASNGGTCKPNRGQDLLTFGWMF